MDELSAVRHHYAQSVCDGLIHADRLIDAYAKVARENFLLSPPWGVIINLPGRRGQVRVTSDPMDLYHDRLVQLDPTQRINNGQPSLWAAAFDRLLLHEPRSLLHLGCGSGYYTAILAAAFPATQLYLYDTAERLQQHARSAFEASDVVEPDDQVSAVDAVVCSFGRSLIDAKLLQRWRDGGVLMTPLTDSQGRGFFIEMTRHGDAVDIRALFGCAFILDAQQAEFPDRVAWRDTLRARLPTSGPLDLGALFAPAN
ncbi:MAG: hypothetical protein AAF499_17465 [Pseudomonadota bacterium]